MEISESGDHITADLLVVGGGIAGMTAAISLGDQGFNVYLVEKEDNPGGMVKELFSLQPTGRNAKEFLAPIIQRVREHDQIQLFTGSEVTDVSGFLGHFEVTIQTGEEPGAGTPQNCQSGKFIAVRAKDWRPGSTTKGARTTISLC